MSLFAQFINIILLFQSSESSAGNKHPKKRRATQQPSVQRRSSGRERNKVVRYGVEDSSHEPAKPVPVDRIDDGRIQINFNKIDGSLNNYRYPHGCFICRGVLTQSSQPGQANADNTIETPDLDLVKQLCESSVAMANKSDAGDETYIQAGGGDEKLNLLRFETFFLCDGNQWGDQRDLKTLENEDSGQAYSSRRVHDIQNDRNFYQIMARVGAGVASVRVTRDGDEKPRSFPGHVDKIFSNPTTFVPLKGRFYAILAVPSACPAAQQPDDNDEFQKFLLEYPHLKRVIDKFKKDGEKQTKGESGKIAKNVIVKPYLCSPGDILVFPANSFFHMTITLPSSEGRVLAILHPYSENAESCKFNPD